jgi:hypothetical protein
MLLKDIISIFFFNKCKLQEERGIRRELAHADAMDRYPTKIFISAKSKPLPLHKSGSQWGE